MLLWSTAINLKQTVLLLLRSDTDPWGGHFSKCPDSLTNYCVHGECRYVKEQQAPSCRWETSTADDVPRIPSP